MGKQISSLSVGLSANVGQFNSGIKSAIPPINRLESSVDGAGRKIGKLESAAKKAEGGGLRGMASSVRELGSRLLEISGIAAAAAVAFEGVSEAAAAFKLAGEFETASVQLKALTGNADTAAGTLEFLRDFSTKSPFEFPELLTTSKRLIAAGVNAKALPTIFNQIGSVAAGLGVPISQVGDTLARVATEGRITGRELRELGPITQVLAKQFHTTSAGVGELADSGRIGFNDLERALGSMTSTGGRFAGILDAQANTVGGRFHMLTETISDDAATVAEKLMSAFHVADMIGGVTNALKGTHEIGSKVALIFSTLGDKIARAVGPAVQIAIGKVEAAMSKVGEAVNYVLDAILKLEGATIPKPEIPQPDPVKVTSILDPATQQLEIKPVVLPPAIRAGSAEAQAARYATAARGIVSPAIGSTVTPPPALPPATASAINAAAAKHAQASASRQKFGYSGVRTELTDAVLGPDGLYHVKTASGGFGGALTPEQYANLKAAQKANRESVSTAIGPNMAGQSSFGRAAQSRAAHGGGVSSIDNWKRNLKSTPDSIQKRNLSSLWRTQESADKIAAWNNAHPNLPVASGVLPRPTASQLQDAINAAQPGGSGPMNAAIHPQAVKDAGSTAEKEHTAQLQNANQWLYRIELNTRASGTGAQIVDF